MSVLREFELLKITDNNGMVDAFGRLRTGAPFTVWESKQIFDDADIADSAENFPEFYDNQQTSGSGTTTTFDVDRASTTLAVALNTAGTRVRQSKRRFNYQPGKSQKATFTGIMGPGATGVTCRYGLFDEDNGLFFEFDDQVAYIVRRTHVTGSAVDTRVTQASWNIDTMDGNGPSGITLDFSKTQIFLIDFEWLGTGRVRYGFIVDGIFVYCHQLLNANVLDVVYMSTPNLPIRGEISNDGTGAAVGMELACSEVSSEGGFNPNGLNRSVDNGHIAITLSTLGTKYALLGIRLRSTHLGLQIDPTFMETVITSANDIAHWELHINPTVTGTFTYANLSLSGTQVAISTATPPTVTDGEIIASGYIKTVEKATIEAKEVAQKIGSLIDGTPDELVLVIQPVTNNTNVLCALNWREVF